MDPIAGMILDPATFNRYAYCRNNPFAFVDSEGLIYAVLNEYGSGHNSFQMLVYEKKGGKFIKEYFVGRNTKSSFLENNKRIATRPTPAGEYEIGTPETAAGSEKAGIGKSKMRLTKNKSRKIWDSVLGRYRTGLLIHAGRQSHLNKTLGCTRMDAQDYEEFSKMVEKDAAAGMQNIILIQMELSPTSKPTPIPKIGISKTISTSGIKASGATTTESDQGELQIKTEIK